MFDPQSNMLTVTKIPLGENCGRQPLMVGFVHQTWVHPEVTSEAVDLTAKGLTGHPFAPSSSSHRGNFSLRWGVGRSEVEDRRKKKKEHLLLVELQLEMCKCWTFICFISKRKQKYNVDFLKKTLLFGSEWLTYEWSQKDQTNRKTVKQWCRPKKMLSGD